MTVQKVKTVIWAADMDRAIRFYTEVFGARLSFQTEVWSELVLADATIGLHGGGEGKRTWTGLSIQTSDVVEAARRFVDAGGLLIKDPAETEEGEEPHLAICADPEGNEIMITQKRS